MKKIALIIFSMILLTACGIKYDDNQAEQVEDRITIEENIETDKDDKHDEDVFSEKTEVNEDTRQNENADQNRDNTASEIEKDKEDQLYKLNIAADENGQVLVLMYHGIKDVPPYHITAEAFRNDLQYMYDNRYMPISMKDFLNAYVDIPAGYTPIVLTFDDGLSSTFSLKREGERLVAIEDCAVDIMEKFCEEHPDFAKHAIFYVNTDLSIFASEKGISNEEKLKWLVDRGYEVSTHTASHKNLSKLKEKELRYEVGSSVSYIKSILGDDYEVNSIAYPFGSMPITDDLKQIALCSSYNDFNYKLDAGFAVGVIGPPVISYDKRFNPYKASRVRASNTKDTTELWDFFEKYEKHPEYRFVSDGMKDIVSIYPVDYNNIDKSRLPETSKLRINLYQELGQDLNKDGKIDCIMAFCQEEKIYYQYENSLIELKGSFDLEKLKNGQHKLVIARDENIFYVLTKKGENIFEGSIE